MSETMWPAGWSVAAVADGQLAGEPLRSLGNSARVGCQPHPVESQGDCLNCGGRGFLASWVITEKGSRHWFGEGPKDWRHASLETAPCPACQGDRRGEYLLGLSGLQSIVLDGKPALDLRLADIRPTSGQADAVEVCRQVLMEIPTPKTSVLFFGPYGTGKTHLICCMVNACRVAGVPVKYVTAEGILRTLRATFGGQAKIDAETLRSELEAVAALAVDELDRVKMTDWAGETLFAILNNRYTRGMATWCATNKSPSELEESETYAALVSRLSAGEMVAVTGDDMRPMAQGRLT